MKEKTLSIKATRQLLPVFLIFFVFLGAFLFNKMDVVTFDEFYGKKLNIKIAPFFLTQTDGKPFDLSFFKNKHTFLFFGFTQCNGICPKNLNVFKKLLNSEVTKKASFVFISVDPRDDIEHVRRYTSSFSKDIVGVLSKKSSDALDLARQFNAFTYFNKEKLERDPASQIQHSGFLYLVNSNSELEMIYPYKNINAEKVISDFNLLSRGMPHD